MGVSGLSQKLRATKKSIPSAHGRKIRYIQKLALFEHRCLNDLLSVPGEQQELQLQAGLP